MARTLPPESAAAESVRACEIGIGADTLKRGFSEALAKPARERACAVYRSAGSPAHGHVVTQRAPLAIGTLYE